MPASISTNKILLVAIIAMTAAFEQVSAQANDDEPLFSNSGRYIKRLDNRLDELVVDLDCQSLQLPNCQLHNVKIVESSTTGRCLEGVVPNIYARKNTVFNGILLSQFAFGGRSRGQLFSRVILKMPSSKVQKACIPKNVQILDSLDIDVADLFTSSIVSVDTRIKLACNACLLTNVAVGSSLRAIANPPKSVSATTYKLIFGSTSNSLISLTIRSPKEAKVYLKARFLGKTEVSLSLAHYLINLLEIDVAGTRRPATMCQGESVGGKFMLLC